MPVDLSLQRLRAIQSESHSTGLVVLAQLVVVATVLGVLIYAINHPAQNWDMLGYVASAISIETSDPDLIHAAVYQQLEAYSDAASFDRLTNDGGYREAMFHDAAAFYQQIPFYKIRIFLVLLIAGLAKLGVNIFVATHILSASFTCAAIVAFYYAFRLRIHPVLWVFLPAIVVAFNFHTFAGTITSDSLAFLWLGLISYSFMCKRWTMLLVFLVTAVFVRTDLIILVALFSFYLTIFKPELRSKTVVTGVAAIAAYLSINHLVGNYGWSTVFYFGVISDMQATHPLSYGVLGVSLEQYVGAVVGNLGMLFASREMMLFEAVTVAYFISIYFTESNIFTFIKSKFIDF